MFNIPRDLYEEGAIAEIFEKKGFKVIKSK